MRNILEVTAPCEAPASSSPKRSKNNMVVSVLRPSNDLLCSKGTLSKLPGLLELKCC